ncbi:MAG: leucine-rich repeat-containing protein kinase family protein [Pedobacter sp.]
MQTLLQLQNGELSGATSLKLSEQLSTFPEEIFQLADTLEILDLSRNKLSRLPDHFGLLKKLKIFFCSDNDFTELPEVLSDCPLLDIVGFKSNRITTVLPKSINPNLRWLILTNNKIDSIPLTIGDCARMQKLMLAGNRLTELPHTLQNCRNLGLLRISANQIDRLPEWLLNMPKLSWLAFSGNPFVESPEIKPLDLISWDELELNHVLGQGASGIIYQAQWIREDIKKHLAVKLFKGQVTSDGLPQDEMNTCITAGHHSGLVELLGQISNHPEDKKGLVMELIPASFHNLGDPPSLESCTRDLFREGLKLEPEQALKIASTIASVAAQLHSKNIMHGDLYAHNILIDADCNTLFSDFGAASFYENSLIEKIEVRAFGYLLADLINLCNIDPRSLILANLQKLQERCHDEVVVLRPTFKAIELQLKIEL